MSDITDATEKLDQVTKDEVGKPFKLEAIASLNQIIRGIEAGFILVSIDRQVSEITNQKVISLAGRVGAMNLTAKLELVRDQSLQDYVK